MELVMSSEHWCIIVFDIVSDQQKHAIGGAEGESDHWSPETRTVFWRDIHNKFVV